MRYLFLLICISAGCLANAQKNIHYTGNVEGGLLTGSKGMSTFIFTTQGVQYNRYTFGIGSGIDFYGFSSVPLFVDVKRKFSDKNTQPFIQADAGLNFINVHSQEAKDQYKYSIGSFENGFFARGGGGLLFRAKKKINVSLCFSYSYKTTAYNYAPLTEDPWNQWMTPLKDNYHFNRWSLGLGVEW